MWSYVVCVPRPTLPQHPYPLAEEHHSAPPKALCPARQAFYAKISDHVPPGRLPRQDAPKKPLGSASSIDNSFRPLPALSSPGYVSTSNPHAIESSGRFWEVEEVLRIRNVRGYGLHARRVKQYLVQWAPRLLSVTKFRYAQKTWKMVKTLQDGHAEKRGALDQKIRFEWAPLIIVSPDLSPKISASDIASHLLIK